MSLDLEKALLQLGKYGRFQWSICISLSLSAIPAGWHILSITFLGGLPTFHCKIPENSDINEYIPNNTDSGKRESCIIYINKSIDNSTQPCSAWSYGDEYGETIVTKWDLVCDQSYLAEVSTSLFFIGVMLGGFIFTYLSDKFGRKLCLICNVVVFCLIGTIVAFSNSFELFSAMRFFNGICQQGFALLAVTMSAELFASEYRHLALFMNNFFWAIGVMTLALLAYLLKNWMYLQLTISLILLLYLIYIKIVPESLHWLVTHDQDNLARGILVKAAKINHVTIDNEVLYLQPQQVQDSSEEIEKHKKKYSCLEILSTPYLRLYAVIMFVFWFVSALSYLGLSLSTAALHGDPYINFALSGLVEVPACIMPVVMLKRIGRRLSSFLTMVITGLPLIILQFLPNTTDSNEAISWIFNILTIVGKFGAASSYQIIVIYSTEIFPTVVRGSGMGICNFCAGIAGVFAPFILYFGRIQLAATYCVLGAIAVLTAPFMLLLPETTNLPLIKYPENYHMMPHVRILK